MNEKEEAEGDGGEKRLTQQGLKDCGYDATDVQACGYNTYFLHADGGFKSPSSTRLMERPYHGQFLKPFSTQCLLTLRGRILMACDLA